jgi:hypothetical protein
VLVAELRDLPADAVPLLVGGAEEDARPDAGEKARAMRLHVATPFSIQKRAAKPSPTLSANNPQGAAAVSSGGEGGYLPPLSIQLARAMRAAPGGARGSD